MTDTADTTDTADDHADQRRRAIPPREPSATTPPPSSRAGRRAGPSSACTRRTSTDTEPAQVLPADDVPLPVGRPAHRPLVHQDADRRARAGSGGCRATTSSSRSASTPSACRPRTPRSRAAATRAPGRCRTSRTCAASSGRWARRSTGSTRSSPPTRRTTAGTSGCSCGSWRRAWPIARCRRSTGAPTTGRWRASRSKAPTATAGAAARSVEKRDLEQWFLRTTDVRRRAARLRAASTGPSRSAIQQTNWIGRSEGAEIDFETAPTATSPAASAARLHDAAGHAVRRDVHGPGARSTRWSPVLTAPEQRGRGRRPTSSRRGAGPRSSACRPIARRPASPSGADAINPVNGERIPIFIADYVLSGYGTGAIMAVPAHDERDFAFAQRFGLPIRRVVAAPGDRRRRPDGRRPTSPIRADERLVNSGGFDGLPADEGGEAIVAWLAETGQGGAEGHLSTARLADQPAALLGHADPGHLLPRPTASSRCPTTDLPVRLPETVDYKGSGDNPLNHDEAFLRRRPARAAAARRGARPTRWTRSSTRPGTGSATCRRTTTDGPVDARLVERWTPVDQYTGGAEHAVMHLLYSAVLDEGDARHRPGRPSDEPFKRLFNQGQILGADGERMSKSRGNVQDPDELVARYGADTVRLFLMFMGPWDQGGPWSPTRDRRRASLPEPGLDAGDRPARPRARRSGCRAPARGRGRGDGRGRAASGRASDAARRHRRLRRLPLQHDGRQAHGAVQHAVPLPRDAGRRRARSGTRRSGCCC